ncbi:MAG TPA: hypothetical protein ENK23_03770 [Sorangium sp.]|nr:hypothetical protein [Sorangium sp.]
MTNSVFFPQDALDILIALERADLDGEELVLTDSGLRYQVTEAVRVLREVTTGDDPRDLCGRVRQRALLTDDLGAELLGDSMLVEDSAYDIVTGFLCTPSNDIEDEDSATEEDALLVLNGLDELA